MIWRFRDIDHSLAERLAQELGQPLKVGEFLAARGFRDVTTVRSFIRAEMKNLLPPTTLTDMDKALERLMAAKRNDELVAVCGDYDADGLTAAALLSRGLKELGHRTLTRVPNRLTDGYGLKSAVVFALAEQGAKLIITVDNGISDYEAVEAAVKLGIDVIITDHHHLPPKLPPAVAIIDPHRDHLWKESPPAGVGVAFLFLSALKKSYSRAGLIGSGEGPALMEYLPLVAIGTIADLAPLTGPNRILVRHGLAMLGSSRLPGLTALKKISRISGDKVNPRDIGFRLAPRLNAAGRLGSADPALELLLAEDDGLANQLASRLEDLNRERHQGQNKLCAEALERLEEEISPDSRTVVLSGEGWPKGLLGLAASRVAEATQKPTVLFTLENGLAVGSGRSAGNFNLYESLNEMRHLFISFGGHSQAAGLTLESCNLKEFQDGLEQWAQGIVNFSSEAELLVDLTVELSDLDPLSRSLSVLEPFGQGHPAPVLVIKGAKISDARPTESGGEHHIKMTLGDGLNRLQVVGFNLASKLCEVKRELDVALSLEISEYRGVSNVSWRLLDFIASD